jgi:uncharacterized protein YbjT (DUF2867 family)
MIVVAGVTGQTGAAVAQLLLDRKQSVRVLVRSADKGTAWQAKGAEVAVLDLADFSALATALRGSEGAYLIVPPAYASADPNATAYAIVDAYSAALKSVAAQGSAPRQVVVLSSVGAQHAAKTGPILPCHYAEQQLSQLTASHCTFLRSGYFMQNLANFVGAVTGQGVLPVLFSPSRKIAIVAVEDIARIAADALVQAASKHQVVEVSGPAELSFEDIAATFSRLLGRPVTAQQVPEAAIVPTLTSIGMPAPTAELYREMSMGVDAGLVAFERGQVRQVRGSVTIEDAILRLTKAF